MTSYATPSDVQVLNRARPMGVGSNQPTASDVQTMLDMTAGEIDQILINKGYTVPVDASTYPEAGAYLRSINAKGAWAMWESSSPNSPNIDRATRAWEDAKQALIAAREVMDVPKDMTRAGPRGPGVTPAPQLACGNRPFFRRHEHF